MIVVTFGSNCFIFYKGKINISVDDTGLGASTSDSLYKFKKDNKTKYASIIINEINFANKAKNEDLYSNFISEIAFSEYYKISSLHILAAYLPILTNG